MLADYAELALHNIRSRKLRSWLTILGIVIGVMAVVALIAIGQGMKQSVEREFDAIGYDTIWMVPGGLGGTGGQAGPGGGGGGGAFFGGGAQPTKINLEIFKSPFLASSIEKVGFTRIETEYVESPSLKGLLRLTGLSPGITADFGGVYRGFKIADGRVFQPEDEFSIVLGNQVALDLGVKAGDAITIGKKKFTVIGVLASLEGRGGFGGINNNALYIPIRTMEALFPSKEPEKEGTTVSVVYIKAVRGTKISEISQRVRQAMTRGGTPVNTFTAEEISNRINTILGQLQGTLAAIAAISLLVGAIGVMNTMYTSVLERTREIGILKAVGAKDKHVLGLFLIESGLIGFIGGVIGIILGVALSSGAGRLMVQNLSFGPLGGGFNPSFSVELVVGTLFFSFVLGAISGTLPARMAANLRTVEALRYE
jgi:putative ABC transport system permease protein